jgi:hypothetical protein
MRASSTMNNNCIEMRGGIGLSLEEEFEDTKGAIIIVYRRRTDNTMTNRKSTKGQTTIYKTYR